MLNGMSTYHLMVARGEAVKFRIWKPLPEARESTMLMVREIGCLLYFFRFPESCTYSVQ